MEQEVEMQEQEAEMQIETKTNTGRTARSIEQSNDKHSERQGGLHAGMAEGVCEKAQQEKMLDVSTAAPRGSGRQQTGSPRSHQHAQPWHRP